jgi:hypothetical protein
MGPRCCFRAINQNLLFDFKNTGNCTPHLAAYETVKGFSSRVQRIGVRFAPSQLLVSAMFLFCLQRATARFGLRVRMSWPHPPQRAEAGADDFWDLLRPQWAVAAPDTMPPGNYRVRETTTLSSLAVDTTNVVVLAQSCVGTKEEIGKRCD